MAKVSIPYARQSVDKSDIDAVVLALKSDYLTTGPKVKEFESALCAYVKAKHAVAVSSGTAALDIAVAALELPAGSEIITTPFTFVASANCALYNGCLPVFADINPKTYNIEPAEISKKITKKTRAIVYVDYAGQPCEIDSIREIAQKHDLFLIEDAAHALGAEYRGRRMGAFADLTCFSFHPVKHITTGEGGAVTTQSEELASKLRMLRNHGIDKTASERRGYEYDMKTLGKNYRITDFQCALGSSQLKKIEEFLKRREQIARMYNEKLSEVEDVTVPFVQPYVRHTWHLYTVLLGEGVGRDRVFESMRRKGIGMNVHYIPTYKFSYYQKLGYADRQCKNAEKIYLRILTLPMYFGLSDSQVEQVVHALASSIREAEG